MVRVYATRMHLRGIPCVSTVLKLAIACSRNIRSLRLLAVMIRLLILNKLLEAVDIWRMLLQCLSMLNEIFVAPIIVYLLWPHNTFIYRCYHIVSCWFRWSFCFVSCLLRLVLLVVESIFCYFVLFHCCCWRINDIVLKGCFSWASYSLWWK